MDSSKTTARQSLIWPVEIPLEEIARRHPGDRKVLNHILALLKEMDAINRDDGRSSTLEAVCRRTYNRLAAWLSQGEPRMQIYITNQKFALHSKKTDLFFEGRIFANGKGSIHSLNQGFFHEPWLLNEYFTKWFETTSFGIGVEWDSQAEDFIQGWQFHEADRELMEYRVGVAIVELKALGNISALVEGADGTEAFDSYEWGVFTWPDRDGGLPTSGTEYSPVPAAIFAQSLGLPIDAEEHRKEWEEAKRLKKSILAPKISKDFELSFLG